VRRAYNGGVTKQEKRAHRRAQLIELLVQRQMTLREVSDLLGMSITNTAYTAARVGIQRRWVDMYENGKGEAAHNDTPRNDTPLGEGWDATSKPIVPNANGANPAHGESPAQQ